MLLTTWRIAQLGLDIRIYDDGELLMAAAPGEADPNLSHAYGLARLPNLVDEARRVYDDHHVDGCLITDGPPWPKTSAAGFAIARGHCVAVLYRVNPGMVDTK